ncbi:MAG: tetratricopeptide repeat protein, partial [Bacteroidota bacterium]
MAKQLFTLLFFLGLGYLAAQGLGQAEKRYVREGNRYYQEGDFLSSELAYRKALDAKAEHAKGAFNLGDALYRQERFDEAANQFQRAADLSTDKITQAEAYHNQGNAWMSAQNYEAAVGAYKEALRRNPQDEETRYNLAYALEKMRREQQQQNQNQDKNQD